MPKGTVEGYRVVLTTTRDQRKALDAFLERVNKAAQQVYQIQKTNIEFNLPMTKAEMESRVSASNPDLDSSTVSDIVQRGLDRLAEELASGQSKRLTRRSRTVDVDPGSLIFAMTERRVRVPHVGVCGVLYNKKGLQAVEGFDGAVNRHAIRSAKVGYHNNDPVVFLKV